MVPMRRLEPHPAPHSVANPYTFTQVPIKSRALEFRVEPFLRDTRHLAGSRPTSQVPTGDLEGLVLGVEHDAEGVPRLPVGRGSHVHTIRFDQKVNLLVDSSRHCVGRRDAGTWTACPHKRPADRFSRCPDCHPLPVRECVFNPRCTDCTQSFCTSPHDVYIAYHGTRPKVGMTRQVRDGHRLIEQGADAWFRVATVDDRFQARNLEDRITHQLQIPQMVPPKHRFARLVDKPPLEAIRRHHERLAPRLESLTGTPSDPLIPLPPGKGRPLDEIPVPAGTVGHHAGNVVAAHGRHLFYRVTPSGPVWALDLKDVISHPVRYATP